MKSKVLTMFVSLNYFLFSTIGFAETQSVQNTDPQKLMKETTQELAKFNTLDSLANHILTQKNSLYSLKAFYKATTGQRLNAKYTIHEAKGLITIASEGQTATLELVNMETKEFKLNGKNFTFDTKKTFQDQLTLMNQLLQSNKTAHFRNLILPEAKAGLVGVAVGVVVAIGVGYIVNRIISSTLRILITRTTTIPIEDRPSPGNCESGWTCPAPVTANCTTIVEKYRSRCDAGMTPVSGAN
jgi:hypothetical protein